MALDLSSLISLIDGKTFRTLKRHLMGHGLTPDEYRKCFGLKPDYPMVAANFVAKRREIAKRIGLVGKQAAPVEAASHLAPADAKDKKPGSATGIGKRR